LRDEALALALRFWPWLHHWYILNFMTFLHE